MDQQELQVMTVAVAVNGEKMRNLLLRQNDPRNPNWFWGLGKIGKNEVCVVVGGRPDGKKTAVSFSFTQERGHRIEGRDLPVRGIGDWHVASWNVRTPSRTSFPGEPSLLRHSLRVSLIRVSKPHLPRERNAEKRVSKKR
ncbi:MAG: hypothetical protein Q8P13_01495 [bacterium]|nr:hypothetical protein [bacterium]